MLGSRTQGPRMSREPGVSRVRGVGSSASRLLPLRTGLSRESQLGPEASQVCLHREWRSIPRKGDSPTPRPRAKREAIQSHGLLRATAVSGHPLTLPAATAASVLTLNTCTSARLRISSTKASGFPLGTGMVPRTTVPGAARVCRTACAKGWLKSSIFPTSSMTHTRGPGLLPAPAWEDRRWLGPKAHLAGPLPRHAATSHQGVSYARKTEHLPVHARQVAANSSALETVSPRKPNS